MALDIIGTLSTGSGYWNAMLWIIGAFIAFLIAYVIYRMGNPTYNKGTEQVKPFLSGWKEAGKEYSHVRAHNIYWGFFEALKDYYNTLMEAHTGIVNDYVSWFVLTTAMIMILVVIAGGV